MASKQQAVDEAIAGVMSELVGDARQNSQMLSEKFKSVSSVDLIGLYKLKDAAQKARGLSNEERDRLRAERKDISMEMINRMSKMMSGN